MLIRKLEEAHPDPAGRLPAVGMGYIDQNLVNKGINVKRWQSDTGAGGGQDLRNTGHRAGQRNTPEAMASLRTLGQPSEAERKSRNAPGHKNRPGPAVEANRGNLPVNQSLVRGTSFQKPAFLDRLPPNEGQIGGHFFKFAATCNSGPRLWRFQAGPRTEN